jgi:hypothetical protein
MLHSSQPSLSFNLSLTPLLFVQPLLNIVAYVDITFFALLTSMRRCQSVDSSLDEYELTNLINMRCRQLALGSSSNNSDTSGLESCFDTEDEVRETNSNTNLTDVDTDIEGENKADIS